MRFLITFLFCNICIVSSFAENHKIIDNNNEFGGKTEEITDQNQKEAIIYARPFDYYLFEESNWLKFVNGNDRDLKRKFDKVINYYNKRGQVVKDIITFNPDCELAKKLKIDYEINYYLYWETGGIVEHYKKEVYYNDSAKKEKGTESGVYQYIYGTSSDIVPEILTNYGFEVSAYEFFSLGTPIVTYEEHYTKEFQEKVGMIKKNIFPCDGMRPRIDYTYSEEFTQKQGYRIRKDYLEVTPQFTLVKAGTEIDWLTNEYGGRTIESTYYTNELFCRFRGIEKQVLDYNSQNILRKSTVEGKNILDKQILYKTDVDDKNPVIKVVDSYNESGLPVSEECFFNGDKSPIHLKSFKKTFNTDDSILIEFSYPEAVMNKMDDFIRNLSFKYDRFGTKIMDSYRCDKPMLVKFGYDTVSTEYGQCPVEEIDISKIPVLEVVNYFKEFNSITKTTYYKNNKKIKAETENSTVSINPLDKIKHQVMNIPLATRLSWDTFVPSILRFAKTDLEKSYAAFEWEIINMVYDKYAQFNYFTSHDQIIILKGTCSTYSLLYDYLTSKLGLDNIYNAGGHVPGWNVGHAWNFVNIYGKYYPLDPTWSIFISDPDKFLMDHWPENPEYQFVDSLYLNYEDYKRKNHLKNALLDHDIEINKWDTDINDFHQMLNKDADVEWKGKYYPATILEQKGIKYHIHYEGYSDSWDEWVTKERIKNWTHIHDE